MAPVASLIMVVNHSADEAKNIKELIEFMDTPQVCMASPDSWRKRLNGDRLDAVFAGPDLSETDVRSLVSDIGELNPNIPIVMLNRDPPG